MKTALLVLLAAVLAWGLWRAWRWGLKRAIDRLNCW